MEIINPDNEQHWLECRTKDITSTEIAALFGISPYITEFELWHRKKSGVVVKFEENERMEWGTALQDAIAAKIGQPAAQILFLSDIGAELDAARQAGWRTVQVLREGATPAPAHLAISSFDELGF